MKPFAPLLLLLAAIACAAQPPAPADPLAGADLSQSPIIRGDTVIFHYSGPAKSVSWNGNFNGWGRADTIPNQGIFDSTRGVWYLVSRFPESARTDYKVVVDGSIWILDPKNPRQQWGGAGPNSELRMPAWVSSPAEGQSVSARGEIKGPFSMRSASLGYDVNYQVYLPAGYIGLRGLPVVYTTDGHEYLDPNLGNMAHTADWLIEQRKTKPFVIVAVDPREPNQPSKNRRMDELVRNEAYAAFITRELPSEIEALFSVRTDADGKALMGTSLGGLFATWIYANYPGHFGYFAIQSPAYWVHMPILEEVAVSRAASTKIFLMAGTYFDGLETTRRMKSVIEQKSVDLRYLEGHEGHSWGFWRARIHEPLIHFFPYASN